ncbi:MAG: hypothetical protein NZT92_17780 [Abditibacteriales bacterium]|nr:hypothetical protein [Abditibacteriales bacterium]MDW8367204.1 hypothetical protein [Abditibacteriales bacterium]
MERVSAQEGTQSGSVVKAWLGLLKWGAAFVLFQVVVPYLPTGGHPVLTVVISTLAFLLLSLALILYAAQSPLPTAHRLALLVIGVLMWGGLRKFDIVSELGLIFAAIGLGMLVALAIRYPNILLPVALVAALVDIWTVKMGGPVSQALEKAPTIAQIATVKIPQMGAARAQPRGKAPPPLALMGVGDFLFLTVLFACLAKFQMNLFGAFWWSVGLSLVAFLLLPVVKTPLPGLPFIALGIIIPNWRYFQFTRAEKFAMLYAAILLAVVLAIGFFVTQALRRT